MGTYTPPAADYDGVVREVERLARSRPGLTRHEAARRFGLSLLELDAALYLTEGLDLTHEWLIRAVDDERPVLSQIAVEGSENRRLTASKLSRVTP